MRYISVESCDTRAVGESNSVRRRFLFWEAFSQANNLRGRDLQPFEPLEGGGGSRSCQDAEQGGQEES